MPERRGRSSAARARRLLDAARAAGLAVLRIVEHPDGRVEVETVAAGAAPAEPVKLRDWGDV